VLAKELFYSGNAVFIDHGLGLYSTYLHLSEIKVAPGAIVERGALIGWPARRVVSRVPTCTGAVAYHRCARRFLPLLKLATD